MLLRRSVFDPVRKFWESVIDENRRGLPSIACPSSSPTFILEKASSVLSLTMPRSDADQIERVLNRVLSDLRNLR